MGWTQAIKHIRCHIQISNRCGQTSTEVLVVGRQGEMVGRAGRPDTRHPWLVPGPHTADWSLAGGKVTPLTCLATGCRGRGQASLLLLDPGHCGDPGPGERGEDQGDPG